MSCNRCPLEGFLEPWYQTFMARIGESSMDEILHQLEAMGNHGLAFTGESKHSRDSERWCGMDIVHPQYCFHGGNSPKPSGPDELLELLLGQVPGAIPVVGPQLLHHGLQQDLGHQNPNHNFGAVREVLTCFPTSSAAFFVYVFGLVFCVCNKCRRKEVSTEVSMLAFGDLSK